MENHVGTINVLQCAGHVAADAEVESVDAEDVEDGEDEEDGEDGEDEEDVEDGEDEEDEEDEDDEEDEEDEDVTRREGGEDGGDSGDDEEDILKKLLSEYEDTDDEWFPSDMSEGSPEMERACSVREEMEGWDQSTWERWTSVGEENEFQYDDDEAVYEDTIAAMAKARAGGHLRLLDSGTFTHMFGSRLMHEVYDIVGCSPTRISGASGLCTLNQRGKKKLQDGTILSGYLNPHLDLDLYCEDALVEECGCMGVWWPAGRAPSRPWPARAQSRSIMRCARVRRRASSCKRWPWRWVCLSAAWRF